MFILTHINTWPIQVPLPDIDMSVGINTGDMFVGNTGAQARMKYAVLWDVVNLASRVGELNGRYESTIIIRCVGWGLGIRS